MANYPPDTPPDTTFLEKTGRMHHLIKKKTKVRKAPIKKNKKPKITII